MSDIDRAGQRIAATPPDDVPALAATFEAEALGPYRAAARVLAAPEGVGADNAAFLLAHAAELGVTPLVEARTLGAGDTAWSIDTVVGAVNALRRSTLGWLEPLLGDTRPLEEKKPGPGPAPKRVCDAAYLALLAVVRFTPNEVHPELDEPRFLAMSPKRRDAFIGGIQQTWTYRRVRGPKS